VVMLGGEHSLTLGVVKAFKERFKDLCVLQLDAHADLRDEYSGTRYSRACVMRRVFEFCPVVQVGIRSLSTEEHQFLERNEMQPFYISTLASDPTS
jgi:agmatinase